MKTKCTHPDCSDHSGFANPSNLARHVSTVHTGVANVQCHICHRTLTDKYVLAKHIRNKHHNAGQDDENENDNDNAQEQERSKTVTSVGWGRTGRGQDGDEKNGGLDNDHNGDENRGIRGDKEINGGMGVDQIMEITEGYKVIERGRQGGDSVKVDGEDAESFPEAFFGAIFERAAEDPVDWTVSARFSQGTS